jgi:hypothetical protein
VIGDAPRRPKEPSPAAPRRADGLPSVQDVAHVELSRPTRSLEVPPVDDGGSSRRASRRRRLAVAAVLLVGLLLGGVGSFAPLETWLRALLRGAHAGAYLVTVDSEPAGAEVYSGPELLGLTPLTMPNDYAPTDIITLRVTKPGYQPMDLTFAGNRAARLRAVLKRGR